jgi:hypothetical protein
MHKLFVAGVTAVILGLSACAPTAPGDSTSAAALPPPPEGMRWGDLQGTPVLIKDGSVVTLNVNGRTAVPASRSTAFYGPSGAVGMVFGGYDPNNSRWTLDGKRFDCSKPVCTPG